ncbi:unnamed protein product [Parajaminaea phylloscopi]
MAAAGPGKSSAAQGRSDQSRYIGPEVLSRWSAYALCDHTAGTLGQAASWSVRVQSDDAKFEYTAEAVWSTGRQGPLGASQAGDLPGCYTALRLLADLCQPQAHQDHLDVFLRLGLSTPASGSTSRASYPYPFLVPAYFQAAERTKGTYKQQQSRESTPVGSLHFDNACWASGLAVCTERAHLFDATMHPALVREVLSRFLLTIPAAADPTRPGLAAAWSSLRQRCETLVNLPQDSELQSPSVNCVAVDVPLHKYLDRRVRVSGTKGNCLLVSPLERRLGLVSPIYGPESYEIATILRESLDSTDTTSEEQAAFATILRKVGADAKPAMLGDDAGRYGPGLFAKSCDSFYHSFGADKLRACVEDVAADIVKSHQLSPKGDPGPSGSSATSRKRAGRREPTEPKSDRKLRQRTS